MAWRRIGDKPLLEPILTRYTAAYVRHQWGGRGMGGELINVVMGRPDKQQHDSWWLGDKGARPLAGMALN